MKFKVGGFIETERWLAWVGAWGKWTVVGQGTHLHEMGRVLRSMLGMVTVVNNTVLCSRNLLGEYVLSIFSSKKGTM